MLLERSHIWFGYLFLNIIIDTLVTEKLIEKKSDCFDILPLFSNEKKIRKSHHPAIFPLRLVFNLEPK